MTSWAGRKFSRRGIYQKHFFCKNPQTLKKWERKIKGCERFLILPTELSRGVTPERKPHIFCLHSKLKSRRDKTASAGEQVYLWDCSRGTRTVTKTIHSFPSALLTRYTALQAKQKRNLFSGETKCSSLLQRWRKSKLLLPDNRRAEPAWFLNLCCSVTPRSPNHALGLSRALRSSCCLTSK